MEKINVKFAKCDNQFGASCAVNDNAILVVKDTMEELKEAVREEVQLELGTLEFVELEWEESEE